MPVSTTVGAPSRALTLSLSSVPAGEQEIKFLVPSSRADALGEWLSNTLRPHPRYPAGTICSIYLDTDRLDSFSEKAESTYFKTKHRLRWYADAGGNPLPGPVFLEIKAKTGATRHKDRVALDLPAAEIAALPLDDRAFDAVLRRHLGGDARGLRPVLEIRYLRLRYGHAVFRDTFCLDRDIRCARTHPALLPAAGGRALDFAVFEQKGGAASPLPVLQGLPRFGVRRASISKYFLAIRQLIPE